MLLDAAARSLKARGFKEIIFIGDSGGNQAGITNVAAKLNEPWKESGVRVFGLTGYYEQSRLDYRAWLQAAFGYDGDTAGTHAGITDTSQMLFVRPAGIRTDQIKPWGRPQDSGVFGDPTKATAEIGRMGIEFKVNAAINRDNAIKNPSRGRGQREGSVIACLAAWFISVGAERLSRTGTPGKGPRKRLERMFERCSSGGRPRRPSLRNSRSAATAPRLSAIDSRLSSSRHRYHDA